MEIRDDGRGFELKGVSLARKRGRLGLLGMKERVEMVGGTFSVESAPGKHTIVRAEIPTTNAREEKRRKPKPRFP
jgi:signal transduction histidine kinase